MHFRPQKVTGLHYYPPTPSPPSECVLPPHQRRGGGTHTHRVVRGWGVKISEDARHLIGFLHYNPSTARSQYRSTCISANLGPGHQCQLLERKRESQATQKGVFIPHEMRLFSSVYSPIEQHVEGLYCKRPVQCLASSKILTPTPSPPGECVPPAFGAGGGQTGWVVRGWG